MVNPLLITSFNSSNAFGICSVEGILVMFTWKFRFCFVLVNAIKEYFFYYGKIIITFYYIIGIKRNLVAVDETNFATDFNIADQHFHLVMGVPEKSGIAGLAVEQNDGMESGLALHMPLEVETGLLEGAHIIYNSVASITNTGPVEFLVPRDNECSFILNQTRLSRLFRSDK